MPQPRSPQTGLPLVFSCLLATAAGGVWAQEDAAPPTVNESSQAPEAAVDDDATVVRERQSTDDASSHRRRADDDAIASVAAEEALETLPDVDLLRGGGPLAPSRVMQRGLAGARTRVFVDGVAVDDITTGDVDGTQLLGPLARTIQTRFDLFGGARALELSFDDVVVPRAGGSVGLGTLQTRWAQAYVAVPFDNNDSVEGGTAEGGSLSVAIRAGESNGRFAHTLPNIDRDTPLWRENNDQRRLQTWMRLVAPQQPLWGGLLTSTHTLIAQLHDGGIPGFAAAPLPDLRGQNSSISGRSNVGWRSGAVDLEAAVSSRLGTRATRNQPGPWQRLSTHGTTGHVAATYTQPLLAGFTLDVVGAGEVGRNVVLQSDVLRDFMRASTTLRLHHAWVDVEAALAGQLTSDLISRMGWDEGALPAATLGVRVGGDAWWNVGGRVSHQSRAPTLQEMFAPQGLLVGNANLRPERSSTAEVFATARHKRAVRASLTAYASHLDEAIIIAHQNAFELTALNTGPAQRVGFEADVRFQPLGWLGLDVTSAGLWSLVEATQAPLPSAAPLTHRAAVTVGERRGLHLVTTLRHRAETPANLFGTLHTPAYTMVDLLVMVPLTDFARMRVWMSNAFDVTHAQDAYLFPLPGRQFFASLDVEVP